LGRILKKYKSLFPHVSAAIQLSGEDKHPSKGDTINYIYTDSKHSNPLCRIISVGSREEENKAFSYDKEKYREMILDAAETVLGYFGFDRSLYANKKNVVTRKWKWLQDLKQERDIETMEKQ
jgi:DNA polymerase elongation subunit (family B)